MKFGMLAAGRAKTWPPVFTADHAVEEYSFSYGCADLVMSAAMPSEASEVRLSVIVSNTHGPPPAATALRRFLCSSTLPDCSTNLTVIGPPCLLNSSASAFRFGALPQNSMVTCAPEYDVGAAAG